MRIGKSAADFEFAVERGIALVSANLQDCDAARGAAVFDNQLLNRAELCARFAGEQLTELMFVLLACPAE